MQLSRFRGQPPLQTGAALVVTARQKEPAFAMGGRKVCPCGTCAQPHLSHLPLAAHITDGVGDPSCALRGDGTRLPTWLTIDLAVILVSLVIIGLGMWLAPW